MLLHVAGEQQSKKRQGEFEPANVKEIELLFCLLPHKESENKSKEETFERKEVGRIDCIWENEEVTYGAPRKIMGAFFPP